MKQDNFLPSDPMDAYISKWLKSWVAAVRLPQDGRQALITRLSYEKQPTSVEEQLLSIFRWTLENLLIKPFDMAFEPMLHSTGMEAYPQLYHHEHGPTLVMRSMSQSGFPYGIGQFNLVT